VTQGPEGRCFDSGRLKLSYGQDLDERESEHSGGMLPVGTLKLLLLGCGTMTELLNRQGGPVISVAGTHDEAETRPRHFIGNVAWEVNSTLVSSSVGSEIRAGSQSRWESESANGKGRGEGGRDGRNERLRSIARKWNVGRVGLWISFLPLAEARHVAYIQVRD